MGLPPNWRPYLVSIAFFVAAGRIVVLPTLEAIIKALQEPEK